VWLSDPARPGRIAVLPLAVDTYFRELSHQLDALRLAAGERRALLAERQVAQAHVLQQSQRVMGRWVRGEKLGRLVHAHRQHFADRFSLPAHRERLGAEPESAADLAGHLYVRQEAHLDFLDPLALALLAAPALWC